MRYAGGGNAEIEAKTYGTIKITNSIIASSSKFGLKYNDDPNASGVSTLTLDVENTQFLDNAYSGLHVYPQKAAMNFTITNNTFLRNGRGWDPNNYLTKTGYPAMLVYASKSFGAWNITANNGPSAAADNNQANGFYFELDQLSRGAITLGANGNNMPYVSGGVAVQTGGTLNITPGTIIKFAYQDMKPGTVDTSFHAYGTLNLGNPNGPPSDPPVILTSFHDDTQGGDTDASGSTASAQPGDWNMIVTHAGGVASLNAVQMFYGGGNKSGGSPNPGTVFNEAGTLSMSNSSINLSLTRGVYVASGQTTLSNNIIANSKQNGLYVASSSTNVNASITNNTFNGNGKGVGASGGDQYAIYVNFGSGLSGNPFLLGNTGSGNTFNGIYMNNGGNAGQWTGGGNPSLPYVVFGNFQINTGDKVTLLGGSIVKFHDQKGRWDTLGGFTAGDATGPVVFTSWPDDSYGGDTDNDGGVIQPQPKFWDKVQVLSGTANLVDMMLRYGGYWGQGCLLNNGGTLIPGIVTQQFCQ